MTMTAPLTATSPTSAPVNGRLSFGGILRSEWIKLLSLRSMRWSIAVMLLLSFGGAALMASAMSGFTSTSTPSMLVQAAGFSTTFTVLVMGVLGVLSMTSEYASGMILSTLTAVPKRTPMFVAKGLAVAMLSFIVGAIGVFGGGLLSAVMIGGDSMTSLFSPEVLASLLGATLYLTLASLLAFGIGSMLRSSAGAIAIVVALLFVAMIAMQLLSMTHWEWVPVVTEWLPASLGNEMIQAPITAGVSASDFFETVQGMGFWSALGGLVAWAAAALIPASILMKTRDAV